MNPDLALELAIVEEYLRAEAQRRAEMLHWIAGVIEEAFTRG